MLLFPDASDLLSRIPLTARTILDAGCGTGALASAYRRMNPNARLLAIDSDPAAAALAAPYFDEVATVDLEADPLPFDVPDGIDCIIYNEILEHLRDPWGLIRRHAEALSPDGIMLLCVANIEYWRVTERLLRGSRPGGATQHMAPAGGFDLNTMQANLVKAGLTLCDVSTREPDDADAAQFAAALTPALGILGIDARNYAKRAAPSHLIWRVRKEPRERMILTGSMLDPVGGVSHVRVVHPIQAIGTDPMVAVSVTDRVATGPPPEGTPRIFVLHRPALLGESGQVLLRSLADAGYLIVTEFDDLPEHFEMMRMGGELSFRGVHALQTSTVPMAEALRRYNPEIAVFPNAVPALPEIRNFTDPHSLTLFFGALNRERDWLPFMPVINAAASVAGERLKFQVVHDRGFFDALESPYKSFTPTCDYETYLRILGGSELSFMPLADTRFNRAKSDLKFIEAASCRVAALASTVVYSNTIEHVRNGLLFRDPVELRTGLLRLLAMPAMARDLADAARGYVAGERMLAYQVAPRIAWYRSLWAKRHVLDAARRERMLDYQATA